uniref:RHS repeat-associated core domain-containing protein n=1 Tax=Paenibacillus camerounensis TaxID=1243663 RepID=UPI001FCB7F33
VNYNLNGQVISEEKLNGTTVVERASYVRGDRLLAKKDKIANKDYYYLYNGHGDVVQIVDSSGTVKNYYSYDAWGTITSQKEEISNSFKYAGETFDAETGLYYLRARYYDPSIGRFLNEDTYEGQIDNPLSQNLYTYVHNNPLIYNDPTGHFVGTITGAILGGIVGGITAAIQKTNIKAGIAGGAVTGAIGGAALDLTLATGGATFVISLSIAAGALGGAAGDVVNQAGNNLAKGKSATSDLNVQSILINAGIGAASGVLGGATAVVMKSFEDATKKIFEGIALNALKSGNETVLDTSISSVYKAAVKMGNTNSTIDYTATVVYSASSNTLVYLVNNQVVQTVVVNVNQVPTQNAKQSYTKADGTVIRVQKD